MNVSVGLYCRVAGSAALVWTARVAALACEPASPVPSLAPYARVHSAAPPHRAPTTHSGPEAGEGGQNSERLSTSRVVK